MDGKPSAEFVAAVSAVADRLFSLTANDELFRRELRSAAQAFLDATEVKRDSAATKIEISPVVSPRHLASSVTSAASCIVPSAPVIVRATSPVTDAELSEIEARCRFKAEATRWAITRQQRLSEGAVFSVEIEPKNRELIARAKAQGDCFLWMCRNQVQLSEIGHWKDVATGFDVIADALALVQIVLACHPQQLEKSMNLLAEAQSALRCSIGIVGGPTDSDQASVHEWLRATAMERQMFIKRFMRADDPADPDTLPDIAARIKAIHDPLLDLTKRRKDQEAKFRRIEYHMRSISSGNGTNHDWNIVVKSVEELINDGLPPSNVRLRELLLPYRDGIESITPTNNPLSSPALSLDRLWISYRRGGKKRAVMISPDDKDGFFKAVATRTNRQSDIPLV